MICIICEKKPAERAYFCENCFKKDILIKLRYFRRSMYSPFASPIEKKKKKVKDNYKYNSKNHGKYNLRETYQW